MRGPPVLVAVFLLLPTSFAHNLASDARLGGQTRQHEQHLPGAARSHASRSHRGSVGRERIGTATPTAGAVTAACAQRGGAAAAAPPTTPSTEVSGGSSGNNSNNNNNNSGLKQRARVLGYFGLWYALNVWYNIVNKKVLNALPLPSSVAVLQLGIGSLWVGTQWLLGIRAPPGKLTSAGAARLTPVAFFHGGGQLATVLSLGAGAVSFTHVVKAMEPFFSALVAAAWFRQVFRWQVYASLVPVVAGVSIACAKGEAGRAVSLSLSLPWLLCCRKIVCRIHARAGLEGGRSSSP